MKRLIGWLNVDFGHYEFELSMVEQKNKRTRLIDQFKIRDTESIDGRNRIIQNEFHEAKFLLICDFDFWFQEEIQIPNLPLRQQDAYVQMDLESSYPNYQTKLYCFQELIKDKTGSRVVCTLVHQSKFNAMTKYLKKVIFDLGIRLTDLSIRFIPWQRVIQSKKNAVVIYPRLNHLHVLVYKTGRLTQDVRKYYLEEHQLKSFSKELMCAWHGIVGNDMINQIIVYLDNMIPDYLEESYLNAIIKITEQKVIVKRVSGYKNDAMAAVVLPLVKLLGRMLKDEK